MPGFSPPLTPPDCDLQDFAFMPLDVARLRDSDLASDHSPEACWAAVLLWAASWHQIPAASMPDNESWIAKHAGYAQRGKISDDWFAVRDGAMHNWQLCEDGRYYHPVVAEKARDAWAAKLEQRWRTEMGRIKKHNDRHPGANVPRLSLDQWIQAGRPTGQPLYVPGDMPPCPSGQPPSVPSETTSKGQREGQGQGQGQGQGDSLFNTDGTAPASPVPPAPPGVPPAPTPRKLLSLEDRAKSDLWKAAVSVLEHGGCPTAQCRTFMGRLVTDYGFPIVKDAVSAAVSTQPADAREYLKATCMRLKGERLNRQEALERRGQAVVDDWATGGADHAGR